MAATPRAAAAPAVLRPATSFMDTAAAGWPEPATRLDAVVFGAPLDATQSFRFGADEGPRAVRELSASLETYSPGLDRDVEDLALADAGDVPVDGLSVESALERIEQAASFAGSVAERIVMIGGEHTVTLAGYRAVRALHPDAALLALDAHLDLRQSYEGKAITHASWLYHAGAEHGFENIFQLGVRSGEREEWTRARELCGFSSPALALPEALRDRPLYLSIDIDVLDPAAAPGTGCPEPGGPTFAEVERLVRSLDGMRIVAVDLVEVFPRLDPSGATAAAAAKLLREVVLLGPSGGQRR